MHKPHPVHFSGSMTGRPSTISIASTGQIFAHMPHEMHLDASNIGTDTFSAVGSAFGESTVFSVSILDAVCCPRRWRFPWDGASEDCDAAWPCWDDVSEGFSISICDMAFTGQTSAQMPQPMHFSGSITALPFSIVIAPTGHFGTHCAQPMHLFESTLNRGSKPCPTAKATPNIAIDSAKTIFFISFYFS